MIFRVRAGQVHLGTVLDTLPALRMEGRIRKFHMALAMKQPNSLCYWNQQARPLKIDFMEVLLDLRGPTRCAGG